MEGRERIDRRGEASVAVRVHEALTSELVFCLGEARLSRREDNVAVGRRRHAGDAPEVAVGVAHVSAERAVGIERVRGASADEKQRLRLARTRDEIVHARQLRVPRRIDDAIGLDVGHVGFVHVGETVVGGLGGRRVGDDATGENAGTGAAEPDAQMTMGGCATSPRSPASSFAPFLLALALAALTSRRRRDGK